MSAMRNSSLKRADPRRMEFHEQVVGALILVLASEIGKIQSNLTSTSGRIIRNQLELPRIIRIFT
jgi:hypothetical protein